MKSSIGGELHRWHGLGHPGNGLPGVTIEATSPVLFKGAHGLQRRRRLSGPSVSVRRGKDKGSMGRSSITTIALVASLGAPGFLWGQTASISGVVRDTSGAVLPGVTVEVSSPALIEQSRTAFTDGEGLYRIVNLRPGTYEVTFSLAGFSTVRRTDIVLTTDVTANVPAELAVGGLDEAITVSGQSPVVDIQNVRQRSVLSEELLNAIPTNKGLPGFIALTPGIVSGGPTNDVGGTKGDLAQAKAYGSRVQDSRYLVNGMSINSLENGFGRGFYANPGAVQETSITLTNGPAESMTGGLLVDVIPKEGGNTVRGSVFATFANESLSSRNTEVGVNRMDTVWDVNTSLGGPISKDRLWWFHSFRWQGFENLVVNNFKNATQGAFTYTPDRSTRALSDEKNFANTLRFTYQASAKDKFNFSWDAQKNCNCHQGLTSTSANLSALVAPEATNHWEFAPDFVQVTWNRPQTSRLLFEAGAAAYYIKWRILPQPEVTKDHISIAESTTGFRYNASIFPYGERTSHREVQRFAMSYITGSHAFKVGVQAHEGWKRHTLEYNQEVSYTATNAIPQSVTLYATPLELRERLVMDLGLYAQDQWTVNRATLNLGVRYDYLNAAVPAQSLGAGRFVGAREFDKVSNVPNWHDISPRLGVAYDLFGNGKTAIKAAFGRYPVSDTTEIARENNPVQTSVNSVNRTWDDRGARCVVCGDNTPQGDFTNPVANGELGPLLNLAFGGTRAGTRFADDVLRGFGVRGYQWQTSVAVQQELLPGIGLNVAYFHTWQGNLLAVNNTAVSASDFSPYQITVPVDPRLPGGGGNVLTGLYDVNPTLVGRVSNLVSHASDYGEETLAYDGVDVTVDARLGAGAMIAGGLSVGRESTNNCLWLDTPQIHSATRGPGSLAPAGTGTPRMEEFCDVVPPWSAGTQLKLAASAPLPWDLQVSGSFRSLPGTEILAPYSVGNAEIKQTLGRDLAAGPNARVTIDLIPPGTMYEDRIQQLDLRFTKTFRVGRTSLEAIVDVYNVFNASPVLARVNTWGPAWGNPLEILLARFVKFGARIEF